MCRSGLGCGLPLTWWVLTMNQNPSSPRAGGTTQVYRTRRPRNLQVWREFPKDAYFTLSFAFAHRSDARTKTSGIDFFKGFLCFLFFTRLALQWVLIGCFGYRSLQSPAVIVRPVLLFLVTASTTCCYWAICVPAAILRSGRRFSGALSGVEP